MSYGAGTRAHGAAVDEGLRAHMLKVYNYMTLGLVVAGLSSWYGFNLMFAPADQAVAFLPGNEVWGLTDLGVLVYATPLRWLIMLSPIGFFLAMRAGLTNFSLVGIQAIFWSFAAVIGFSTGYILATYTGESIVRVFFIAASMFGVMSLYGYTTKRSLSGLFPFLMMGTIGLFAAMFINVVFLESSAMMVGISLIGVGLFVLWIAFDTQMIKNVYLGSRENEDAVAKLAIIGAAHLLLDFINLFVFLMHLLGNRN